ncbi:hypothetical protein Syun_030692 [Stephania yunnanensis]|uniref:Uncharacterized protein n=1 Tax=Stephania yunnanensis TaxID=152371 RepID=A0AAP0HDW2_9MAGN
MARALVWRSKILDLLCLDRSILSLLMKAHCLPNVQAPQGAPSLLVHWSLCIHAQAITKSTGALSDLRPKRLVFGAHVGGSWVHADHHEGYWVIDKWMD